MYQSSIWGNGKSHEHLLGTKPKFFTGEFHGISMDLMDFNGFIWWYSIWWYVFMEKFLSIHLNSSKFHIFGDFSLVSFPHLWWSNSLWCPGRALKLSSKVRIARTMSGPCHLVENFSVWCKKPMTSDEKWLGVMNTLHHHHHHHHDQSHPPTTKYLLRTPFCLVSDLFIFQDNMGDIHVWGIVLYELYGLEWHRASILGPDMLTVSSTFHDRSPPLPANCGKTWFRITTGIWNIAAARCLF